MNLFELERLRQEGKDVILPGGRCALDESIRDMFDLTDMRVDEWIARGQIDEQMEVEDETGLIEPRLLGC